MQRIRVWRFLLGLALATSIGSMAMLATAQQSVKPDHGAETSPAERHFTLNNGVLEKDSQGSIAADRVKVSKLLHVVNPKFPPPHTTGECVLSVLVGVDGRPHDIAVVQSLSADYDHSAREAVEKYRFEPATLDGKPVAFKIIVKVQFK